MTKPSDTETTKSMDLPPHTKTLAARFRAAITDGAELLFTTPWSVVRKEIDDDKRGERWLENEEKETLALLYVMSQFGGLEKLSEYLDKHITSILVGIKEGKTTFEEIAEVFQKNEEGVKEVAAYFGEFVEKVGLKGEERFFKNDGSLVSSAARGLGYEEYHRWIHFHDVTAKASDPKSTLGIDRIGKSIRGRVLVGLASLGFFVGAGASTYKAISHGREAATALKETKEEKDLRTDFKDWKEYLDKLNGRREKEGGSEKLDTAIGEAHIEIMKTSFDLHDIDKKMQAAWVQSASKEQVWCLAAIAFAACAIYYAAAANSKHFVKHQISEAEKQMKKFEDKIIEKLGLNTEEDKDKFVKQALDLTITLFTPGFKLFREQQAAKPQPSQSR